METFHSAKKSSVFTPGANCRINIKSKPNTRIAVLGLDQSVYLLRNKYKLTHSNVSPCFFSSLLFVFLLKKICINYKNITETSECIWGSKIWPFDTVVFFVFRSLSKVRLFYVWCYNKIIYISLLIRESFYLWRNRERHIKTWSMLHNTQQFCVPNLKPLHSASQAFGIKLPTISIYFH